jgi:ssDNA-binding Zn-finger/Zn-ribbon topoisomerase 1
MAPWNEEQSESLQDVYCDTCDLTWPDMEITWSNQSDYGYTDCPGCGTELEIKPLERDEGW